MNPQVMFEGLHRNSPIPCPLEESVWDVLIVAFQLAFSQYNSLRTEILHVPHAPPPSTRSPSCIRTQHIPRPMAFVPSISRNTNYLPRFSATLPNPNETNKVPGNKLAFGDLYGVSIVALRALKIHRYRDDLNLKLEFQ